MGIDWTEIDVHLFDGRVVHAIAAYRVATSSSLQQAIVECGDRIELLWATRAAEFNVPRAGYGSAVNT